MNGVEFYSTAYTFNNVNIKTTSRKMMNGLGSECVRVGTAEAQQCGMRLQWRGGNF